MSDAKHTPGPWYWAGLGDLRGAGDLEVGDCLDRLSDKDEVPRFAADARLIAAAPDLLAACEAIDALDCCTGYSFPDSDWPLFWEALEKARAALVKARGA
jgi:hypothetical protein